MISSFLRFSRVAAVSSLAIAISFVSGLSGHTVGRTVVIASDLPLQGRPAPVNDSTNKALQLYLSQINNRVGNLNIALRTYDNSTAAVGAWTSSQCTINANSHVAAADEIAVIGMYNSGCAKIEIPILNQSPNGPMFIISHASTNPGLTKTWLNPAEPNIYYPTGGRNFARIAPTDDNQGLATAQYAKSVGVKTIYVLNDGTEYGKGQAQSITGAAVKNGLRVLSSGASGETWDSTQSSYATMFERIKVLNPDLVYFGGIFDNNGGQLIRDKVAVLGNNSVVKVAAPDGFTGYPDLVTMPQAQGIYLTFTGGTMAGLLQHDRTKNVSKFAAAYRARYGSEMFGSYPLYAVAALQVALAAISQSDGTRSGVNNAVFSRSGIQISEEKSVLGRGFSISKTTGDTSLNDVTIEVVGNQVEQYLQLITVK